MGKMRRLGLFTLYHFNPTGAGVATGCVLLTTRFCEILWAMTGKSF